jgi:hypothetical protein
VVQVVISNVELGILMRFWSDNGPEFDAGIFAGIMLAASESTGSYIPHSGASELPGWIVTRRQLNYISRMTRYVDEMV